MRMTRLLPALLLTFLCAARPAPAQDHPLKLAIANPYLIYTSIKESKDFSDKQALEARQFQAEGQQRAKTINDMRQEREQIKPDHPKYADLSKKIDQVTAEAKVWQEVAQLEQARAQKTHFITTYRKIELAVAQVAEREKVDLVLSTGPRELPPNIENMNFQELDALIASRKIMYSKNIPDITEKVIAQLDADYAKGQK